MRLPRLEYAEPDTLQGVFSLLAERGGEAKLLAGGTDLLPSLKQGLLRPSCLVSLQRVRELAGLEFTREAGLRLGPLTKLRELETSALVAERYPLLRQAAKAVGSPQLRHMGTVGGNLLLETRCCYYNQSSAWRSSRPTCLKLGGKTCNAVGGGGRCFAVFSGDLAPALLALGASVTVGSPGATKTVPLRELYTGDGKEPFRLAPHELLLGLHVPPPAPGTWSAYYKHRTRKAIDFPLASAAVLFVVERGGTFSRARIALGGVAPGPVEVEGVEEVLAGKTLDDRCAGEAALLAGRHAKPVENLLGSSRVQRKWMIEAFVRRAVGQALQAAA